MFFSGKMRGHCATTTVLARHTSLGTLSTGQLEEIELR